MICEKYHISSTTLLVRVYRLICLQNVTLGTLQKLSFKLPFLFGFYLLAIQPNFVTNGIAPTLNAFIVSLLLKLLSMMVVFLANNYQFSLLCWSLVSSFRLGARISVFLKRDVKMIATILLKKRMAATRVFGIIISKLGHQ